MKVTASAVRSNGEGSRSFRPFSQKPDCTKPGSDHRLHKTEVRSAASERGGCLDQSQNQVITKLGTNNRLSILLRQINSALRGWTVYFRHGASQKTFDYLRHYTWWRQLDGSNATTPTTPGRSSDGAT